MTVDELERHITRGLAEFVLIELGCAVATPSEEAWCAYEVDGPYRFGWMPPMVLEESLVLVSFCPTLIAKTVMGLSDDEIDAYVSSIGMFLSAMLDHPDQPAQVSYAAVEELLYRQDPELLALISRVESDALDAGIARLGA